MIKIDVYVQEKKWKKYITNPHKYLKNKTNKIKNSIPLLKNKNAVFSLLLTGDKKIKKLNKKFRNQNRTTDVLSFPFYNDYELKKKIKKKNNIYLGDVILNYYKFNKLNKNDFLEKFNKLWIHGFLHLVGHKHKKDKDFKRMSKLENRIFNKIEKIK